MKLYIAIIVTLLLIMMAGVKGIVHKLNMIDGRTKLLIERIGE